MRIAFHTPAVPGHLNPFGALARGLQRRGHQVCFLALPDSALVFENAGFTVFSYCSEVFPPGEFNRRSGLLSQLYGPEAARVASELARDGLRAIREGGEMALRDAAPHVLITDEVSPGFNRIAAQRSLPLFRVSAALYLDTSGYTPPCIYDWPHQTGSAAMARNRAGLRHFITSLSALNRQPETSGDAPSDSAASDVPDTPLAHLTQLPKEFDFHNAHWPGNFYHCGPFLDGRANQAPDFPWQRLTGEPLIYASMGTLQNGLDGVYRIIADAVSGLKCQLVLRVGGAIARHSLDNLPPGTIVCYDAPQLELLKRAALCITHAGLNTTLEALAHGVPLVAIPITFDQPGVAARIAHSGAGRFVPFSRLSIPELRAAVASVLADPSYRAHAQRLQRSIARTNGVEMAADIIERKLGIVHEPSFNLGSHGALLRQTSQLQG